MTANPSPSIESPNGAVSRLFRRELADGYHLAALHVYTDGEGNPLFYRPRLKHPDGRKVIKPMHLKGNRFGMGEPAAPKGGKPLYRLAELLQSDATEMVWVAEGEGCADAMAQAGVLATTSGSATSAEGADWSPLTGRHVRIWPDNNEPGRQYAEIVAAKLRTLNCRVEVVDIEPLDLPDGGDCVDLFERQSDAAFRPYLEALPVLPEPEEDVGDLQRLDFETLAELTPPPRRWIVRDWIPAGHVTLLAGKGGVGKSLLAQQLGTTIAAARDWLGEVPEAGEVFGLFCEDDHDELWRRQHDICKAHGLPMAGVGQWLHYDARAGKQNALTRLGDSGDAVLATMPLFDWLRRRLRKRKRVKLLILDNVSQMFWAGHGAENDKALVTAFCNLLTDMALEFDIGVLLLAHPAKAEGSEYSGSVAWEAAVRSRLFLTRESDAPNSRIILTRGKANYAPRGGDVTLAWEKGAFVRCDGRQGASGTPAATSRNLQAQCAVLDALVWLTERKLTASHRKPSGNWLPRVMKGNGLDGGFDTPELISALDMLIADKRVEVDALLWRNERRQPVMGLKSTDEQSQVLLNGVPPIGGHHPLSNLRTGSGTDEQNLRTGEQTDEQTEKAA